jgi:hypothetical protein
VEASQIACIKCESDIRYVTIVGVASVTAPTAVVAVGGDVVFTVTTIPSGFEHMLEWTATGEPHPMASQEGGATFTAHWDTPGSYVVTSACACVSSCDPPNPQSHASTTVAVVRVDIEQAELNVCQQMTAASLHLTGSYWAPEVEGDVIWSSSPPGLSGTGSGGTYTFNPSASEPGTYVVTARPSLLDSCHDTCIVRVLKVEFVDADEDPIGEDIITGGIEFTTATPTIQNTTEDRLFYVKGAGSYPNVAAIKLYKNGAYFTTLDFPQGFNHLSKPILAVTSHYKDSLLLGFYRL